MTERHGDPGEPPEPDPTLPPAGGSDPQERDWATEIRRLRRERGEQLRRVFSTFDDEQEEP